MLSFLIVSEIRSMCLFIILALAITYLSSFQLIKTRAIQPLQNWLQSMLDFNIMTFFHLFCQVFLNVMNVSSSLAAFLEWLSVLFIILASPSLGCWPSKSVILIRLSIQGHPCPSTYTISSTKLVNSSPNQYQPVLPSWDI